MAEKSERHHNAGLLYRSPVSQHAPHIVLKRERFMKTARYEHRKNSCGWKSCSSVVLPIHRGGMWSIVEGPSAGAENCKDQRLVDLTGGCFIIAMNNTEIMALTKQHKERHYAE